MSWLSRYLKQKRLEHAPVVPLGDTTPLVHPVFPLAICWRPKSACTTVLKWFLFHSGLLEEATAYSHWPHCYREQILFESPGYTALCQKSLFGGDKFVVKFIRDPARRAVSNFLQVIRRTDESSALFLDIRDWKESVKLGDQDGLTFQQFMRYVVDRMQSDHPLDAHLRPQRCPIQDPCVDAFLPIENLADELRNLERQYGLPSAPVAELSESAHHNPPTMGNRWQNNASDVVVTPSLLESLGIPSANVFLDEESLRLIARAYAKDYAAYHTFYSPRLPGPGHVAWPGDAGRHRSIGRCA
jgi:hypothetical protein